MWEVVIWESPVRCLTRTFDNKADAEAFADSWEGVAESIEVSGMEIEQ